MSVSLPPGCVTGVGSLPFVDPFEAVEFVAHYSPVLPFWPQLPGRHPDEAMIVQGLGPLGALLEPAARPYCWQPRAGASHAFAAGLDGDKGCLVPTTAAGFFAFEDAFRNGRFPHAAAVKAQLVGPVTLADCVLDAGEPLARHPEALGRVASFLARQAVWQVERLQRLGKRVVFVLDEPTFSLAPAVASPSGVSAMLHAIAVVIRAAQAAGAVAGLHCCAPLPVGLLPTLNLDLLSFDAQLPLDERGWFELARAIVERSGYLAFGLVPTGRASEPGPTDLFARWSHLAATAGDVMAIANRTIITATCGLGLATPATAISVFEQCRRLGETIGELSATA